MAVATIGLAIGLAAFPVVIAEGSLHISGSPATDPRAAERLARIYEADWHAASIATPDGVTLSGWFFVPAGHNGGPYCCCTA